MRFKTFLINLDRDTERLRAMDQQLQDLRIPYQRFAAIMGGDLPGWLVPYLGSAQLSPGEIGCYASHLAIMKEVADGADPALVLEDDLVISPEVPELIQSILGTDQPWEITRLSSKSRRPLVPCSPLPNGYSLVQYLRVPLHTGAYLIKPDGARRFLGWRTARYRPIDVDLMRVWEHRTKTVGVWPLPITQDIGPSTIEKIGGRNKKKGRPSAVGRRFDELSQFIYNITAIGTRKTLSAWMGRHSAANPCSAA